MGNEDLDVRKRIREDVAGRVSGCPSIVFHSGSSSSSARGSMTAPDRIWDPSWQVFFFSNPANYEQMVLADTNQLLDPFPRQRRAPLSHSLVQVA